MGLALGAYLINAGHTGHIAAHCGIADLRGNSVDWLGLAESVIVVRLGVSRVGVLFVALATSQPANVHSVPVCVESSCLVGVPGDAVEVIS